MKLVALLAATAATACGARWALQNESEMGALEVRRAKDTGVFTLGRKKAGCRNWEHIKMGDVRFVHSADACSQVCRMTEGCVGFGFQENACHDEVKGVDEPGGCMLWKQPCQESFNECWNDYVLVISPGPDCEVPDPPGFKTGGRGCPGASYDSCLNSNQSYALFGEAWMACGVLPECAVIMRDDSSRRYYLRREADPESAAGESATYFCNFTSTTMETTTTRTLVKRIMVTKGLETFEISTFDWEKLNDHPELYDEVVEEIKKSVAEEYGVSPDAVDIELSSGA